jgi:hypothetical protein
MPGNRNSLKKAPSSVPRKRHDENLSAKERVFVHALRALFDPKGKQKSVLPEKVVKGSKAPKGIVSVQGENGGITFRRQTRSRTLGPSITPIAIREDLPSWVRSPFTPKKWVHPATKRKVRKAKRSAELAEGSRKASSQAPKAVKKLMVTVSKLPKEQAVASVKKSPSKLRRAEKRDAFFSRLAKEKNPLRPAEVDRKVRQPKKLHPHQGSACLGDDISKGVKDLDVVVAFGGASALLMLSKLRNVPYPKTSLMFTPNFNRVGGKSIPSVSRDYTKAVKGLSPESCSEKNKIGLSAFYRGIKTPPVKKEKVEKKPKGVTPSRMRRRERRADHVKTSTVEASVQTEAPALTEAVVVPPPDEDLGIFDSRISKRIGAVGRNLKRLFDTRPQGAGAKAWGELVQRQLDIYQEKVLDSMRETLDRQMDFPP